MNAASQLAASLENVANKIERLAKQDKQRALSNPQSQLNQRHYAEWIAQFLHEEADRLMEKKP